MCSCHGTKVLLIDKHFEFVSTVYTVMGYSKISVLKASIINYY